MACSTRALPRASLHTLSGGMTDILGKFAEAMAAALE
jgi:hypothetical protein